MAEEHHGVQGEILGSTRVGGNGYLNEGMASSLLSKQMGKKIAPGSAKFLMDRIHMSRPHVAGHTTHRTDIPYSDIHRMYTFETKDNILMLAIDSDLPDMRYYQSFRFRSHNDYATAKGILLGELPMKSHYDHYEADTEPYYKPIKKVYGGISPAPSYDSVHRVGMEYSPRQRIRRSHSAIRSSKPNCIFVNNVGFSEGTTYHEKPHRPVVNMQSNAPRPPVVMYPLDAYQNGYRSSEYVEEQPRDYTIHRVSSRQGSIASAPRPHHDDLILRRVSRVNPSEPF